MNCFKELSFHLVKDERPSEYFNNKEKEGLFSVDYPFTMLGALKNAEQNPVWHPEGNCWNHTMQVVDNAALYKSESEEPDVLMWSALLHDIGKPSTTRIRKGKIVAYDHDKAGEKLALEFLSFFNVNKDFIKKVSKMVRWHMQMLMVVKDLPFADIRTMKKEVPLKEIALLAMCDRLGRGEASDEAIKAEKNNIRIFLEKCYAYK